MIKVGVLHIKEQLLYDKRPDSLEPRQVVREILRAHSKGDMLISVNAVKENSHYNH